jgi:short-subunit dehydrogenase
MGVNFNGVLYGLQTFVPHMLAHGESGHIVNTASIAAFIPGGGPYGVSKYGVIHLSEALHRDLITAESKLSASVLIPGWVNTKIDEAERNRPGLLANANNPAGAGLQLGDTLKAGMSPESVADMVFEAVESDRFYILPHPGWDDVITDHARAVVARQGPYELDLTDLMAKRAQGISV